MEKQKEKEILYGNNICWVSEKVFSGSLSKSLIKWNILTLFK